MLIRLCVCRRVHLYLYEWWASLLVTDAKANFQKMRAENRFWGLTDRKSFHPGSRCDAGEEPAPDLEDILTELITVRCFHPDDHNRCIDDEEARDRLQNVHR